MKRRQSSTRSTDQKKTDLPDRLKCHLKGTRTLDEAFAMMREFIEHYRALGVTHLSAMTLYYSPGILDAERDKVMPVTRIGKQKLADFTIKEPYPCAADEYDRKKDSRR
jgi:hypothetical protein